jgi:signal peptidase I
MTKQTPSPPSSPDSKGSPVAAAVVLSKKDRKKAKSPGDSARGDPLWRMPSQAGIRETIESVAVAFILAFLFRTFEAEAFVIPTGSMAPTLMGRHKDLTCPKCGYPFQASASEEVDRYGNWLGEKHQIVGCTCPMCRYYIDLTEGKAAQSYTGDHILVCKFAYQFQEPQPWDIVVFRYPGDGDLNYIKRLIGLPNETVRIQNGDIYIKRPDDEDFYIRRKSPEKLLAMLQPVYDNDLTPRIMEYGFPARWTPWNPAGGNAGGQWQSADQCLTYQTDGQSESAVWLRYRNLVPSAQNWSVVKAQGRLPPEARVPAQLISNYAGYNTEVEVNQRGSDEYYWVGDLALQCTVDVQSDRGELLLELVKGGRKFQCRIDVASGEAALMIDGQNSLELDGRQYSCPPPAKTAIRGPGKHEVRFSNCDEQMLLWVDGKTVEFQGDTAYPSPRNTTPQTSADGADDLAPAAVGSRGAAVSVSHLKVLRDIYYIALKLKKRDSQYDMPLYLPRDAEVFEKSLNELMLSKPSFWPGFFADRVCADFPLGSNDFFVLGDNSARSSDGRYWPRDGFPYCVNRDLLIGEAVYIYWPHSWDSPVYMFPNFARMHFVR